MGLPIITNPSLSDGLSAALSDASFVGYTPAVLTDWIGDVDPGDVQEALDQLVERVSIIETADAVTLTADDIEYTPLTPTDWETGSEPESVYEALNQAADRLNDGTYLASVITTAAPDLTVNSLDTNGTGGAGRLRLANQSSAPSTPSSALNLYADASNRLAWKHASGFSAILDTSGFTADRVITIPNATGTLVTQAASQTLTNKTLTSPTLNTPVISGGTIDNTVIGGTTKATGSFTTLGAWHPAPTGAAGGISVKGYNPNEGGYASMEISGTSASWTTGKGLVFDNYAANIRSGSNFITPVIAANIAWLGSSSYQATDPALTVVANSGRIDMQALLYTSGPYPTLAISAPELLINTKAAAAWSDGGSGFTGYGTERLRVNDAGLRVEAASALSFGDETADNAWRIVRSGNDLLTQRRETGSWVTKFTASSAGGYPGISASDLTAALTTPPTIGGTTPAAITGTTGRFNSDLTLAGAPGKIKPATNSTTALQFTQADGTAFITLDTTNKRLGVNTSAPTTRLHLASEDADAARYFRVSQHNSGAQSVFMVMHKSRGTQSSPTIVSDGDYVGVLGVGGYDGAAYTNPTGLVFRVNGTPSLNNIPVDLIFAAGAGVSSPENYERARILASNGNFGIGLINPAEKLEVSGNIKVSGTGTFGSTHVARFQGDYAGNGELGAGVLIGSLSSSDVALFPSIQSVTVGKKVVLGYWAGGGRSAIEWQNVSSGQSSDILIGKTGGNVGIGLGASAPNNKLDVAGTVQADGLRLDVTPTAETITPTHTITISVNGTNYKIPLVAASG